MTLNTERRKLLEMSQEEKQKLIIEILTLCQLLGAPIYLKWIE